jgi:hypothetical protein
MEIWPFIILMRRAMRLFIMGCTRWCWLCLGQRWWVYGGYRPFLGTLAVPLLYLLGRTWFDRPTALVAALALSFSFWGLMYARFGLRHVTMPVLVLAAFFFFWRGWGMVAGRLLALVYPTRPKRGAAMA